MTTRDKLFGFGGRIRREDWWLLGILLGIAQVVVTFALGSLVSVAHLSPSAPAMTPFAALAALPPYVPLTIQLAFLWPTISLSAQRYHDRNKSAWPVLAYFAVIRGVDYAPATASSWTLGLAPAFQQIMPFVWSATSFALGVWFLVSLGFMDGTPGPNRFGPSPKGLSTAPYPKVDFGPPDPVA